MGQLADNEIPWSRSRRRRRESSPQSHTPISESRPTGRVAAPGPAPIPHQQSAALSIEELRNALSRPIPTPRNPSAFAWPRIVAALGGAIALVITLSFAFEDATDRSDLSAGIQSQATEIANKVSDLMDQTFVRSSDQVTRQAGSPPETAPVALQSHAIRTPIPQRSTEFSQNAYSTYDSISAHADVQAPLSNTSKDFSQYKIPQEVFKFEVVSKPTSPKPVISNPSISGNDPQRFSVPTARTEPKLQIRRADPRVPVLPPPPADL